MTPREESEHETWTAAQVAAKRALLDPNEARTPAEQERRWQAIRAHSAVWGQVQVAREHCRQIDLRLDDLRPWDACLRAAQATFEREAEALVAPVRRRPAAEQQAATRLRALEASLTAIRVGIEYVNGHEAIPSPLWEHIEAAGIRPRPGETNVWRGSVVATADRIELLLAEREEPYQTLCALIPGFAVEAKSIAS